jgi:aspartate aminotransferase-like enzyme
MSYSLARDDVERVVLAIEAGLTAAGYKFQTGTGVTEYKKVLTA